MTAFDPTPLRPDAPAMPHASLTVNGVPLSPGLTARQHAAIALRVPDSGTEWLDAMIRESQRDQFAQSAAQALLARGHAIEGMDKAARILPYAFVLADVILRSRDLVHSAFGDEVQS